MSLKISTTGDISFGGDVVGGDKTTTTLIVSAAVRQPVTLLEKAEEMVLDAESLAFGEAADLIWRRCRGVRSSSPSSKR